MRVHELIDDETRRKMKATVHRPKRKRKEKLSTRDIEDLMDMRRDTYKRHKGRVRRK